MAKNVNQSLVKDRFSLSKKKDGLVDITVDPPPTPIPIGGFEISLVLDIIDDEVTLTGRSLAGGIKVEFHRPWKEAPKLGTITEAISKLSKSLGLDTDFGTKMEAFIKNLPEPLRTAGQAVTTAQIIVTDFVINTTGDVIDEKDQTAKNVYQIGLGLVFLDKSVKVGDISLKTFLIKYTYLTDHKKKAA
ncbi:MAG: hypothetical protein JWO09_3655 [Bacteroidetes bacterium]|nr:hypothetical protein [Bacteroidota bacterium]